MRCLFIFLMVTLVICTLFPLYGTAEYLSSDQITNEKYEAVFGALESYAGYMINASNSRAKLAKYYVSGSQPYLDILKMGTTLWANRDRGHEFLDKSIVWYRPEGDNRFTVRAGLTMRTVCADDTERDFPVLLTLSFLQEKGVWCCDHMSNVDPRLPGVSKAPDPDWNNLEDGIFLEECCADTFNAHVMIIQDPARVYLGLSAYSGFSVSIPGKRLNVAMEDENASAAVNAGAFNDDGTASATVGSVPAGLTIHDSAVVSDIYKELVPGSGFCGFDQDNKMIVFDNLPAEAAMRLGIRDGCACGPVLIKDGIANAVSDSSGYAPRTAMGQRADGSVIFVCADGMQAGSLGATYQDMINILMRYGAVNACSMAGGSSSVMFYRDVLGQYGTAGEIRMVNSYSALQSQPRKMPTFWMVRPQETEGSRIPCTGLSQIGQMSVLTHAGQYWRLMLRAEPEDTTDLIVYQSGDESVVTVDDHGRVVAVGEGVTIVTATCGQQQIAIPSAVHFEDAPGSLPQPAQDSGSTTLKLNRNDISIVRKGTFVTLELAGNIPADEVTWSTSDSSIATVSQGTVNALGRGICIITASWNGQTAECVVRCKW